MAFHALGRSPGVPLHKFRALILPCSRRLDQPQNPPQAQGALSPASIQPSPRIAVRGHFEDRQILVDDAVLGLRHHSGLFLTLVSRRRENQEKRGCSVCGERPLDSASGVPWFAVTNPVDTFPLPASTGQVTIQSLLGWD